MAFQWISEQPAVWDTGKVRIIGEAQTGIFDRRYRELGEGTMPPGDWWRIEEGGTLIGYAWMDLVWGDAEILLATAPEARERGAGSFALENLEREARARGVNYLYNVVRPAHPDRERLSAWLQKRGFRPCEDGSLLRSVVPRG